MARPLTAIFSSLALLGLVLPADAATIMTGAPVAVNQSAQFVRDGQSRTLVVGTDIQVGDTIRTGPVGRAQLLFMDNTRMVVGENSTLNIETALFRPSGTAEKLAVSVTRGAFRFASGKSESSAYSVRTPTATLGVRGTSFDLVVDDAGNTWVTLIEGEVFLCSSTEPDACVVVQDNCSVHGIDTAGAFSAPETKEERDSILQERFTFIMSQEDLRDQFHSRVELCDVPPKPVLQQLRGILDDPEIQPTEIRSEPQRDPPEDTTDFQPLQQRPTPRILVPTRLDGGWTLLPGGGTSLTRQSTLGTPPTVNPITPPVPMVPLPASVWLLLAGLGVLAAGARLRSGTASGAGTGAHGRARAADARVGPRTGD